jgi:anti-anti-sigma factor
MKMTVLERHDHITHIALSGRLDTTGAEDINQQLSALVAAGKRSAIIDLSDIEFLASRGIGLLFDIGKRLRSSGRKLVLLNPQGMVASVLKTSKVDRVMPIAQALEEAISLAQGQAPAAHAPPAAGGTPAAASSVVAAVAPRARPGELKISIQNDLSELPRLNSAIAQFLQDHEVAYRPTYAVNLAIDELVVNVIRYAYVDPETHTIDIELAILADQIVLRIVDDGRPFDPRRGPALDLHAEDRESGGLGLLLVLDVVDALQYRRLDDKNWVEVRVHLQEETGAPSQLLGAL